MALAAAAFWGAAASAAADSWAEPQEENFYSANDAYYLHVVPGAGVVHARGTLVHVLVGGGEEEVWSRELQNPTAPVTALVSRDGGYVVTFDDWATVGYGPNVVVLYGPGGELVRALALEDFLTEAEIAGVPFTVSSRWWRGEAVLDEAAGVVVLSVVARAGPEGEEPPTREVRLELATGKVVP
jgi:hypothetical protein